MRRQLGYTDPQGAARLVFSEADGLSGLVVDRYGEYLAVQPTAPFGNTVLYRARLANLSASAAANACTRLNQRQLPCVVVRPTGA